MFFFFFFSVSAKNRPNHFGVDIGKFVQYAHQVNGFVFAVDDTTLFIRGFSYDGDAPAAYFFAGNGSVPSPVSGFIIPYPDSYNG